MARLSAISECGQSRLKVRKNRRVTLQYRVTLSSGEEFDSSGPNSPLEIVCGRGETIQGLEKRILGMSSGEQKEFVVPPEEAFGPRDETLMKKIPTAELPMDVSPKVGNRVPYRDKGTRLIGRIVDVRSSAVVADFNHPLAGKPLHYEVRILQVAEAIPEQLAS